MRCVCRPVWAVSVLAAFLVPASHATAGPIEWGFSTHLARAGGAYGPAAGWGWLTDEFIGGDTTIHEVTFSRLAAAGPGHGWGWQSVRVGAVVPDGPSYDPLHWAESTFDINLTLTDLASGEAGTLRFTATGWEDVTQDMDHPWVLLGRKSFALITGDAEQTLTLGGNTYHVGLRAVGRYDTAELVADVRVGDVQATPEPTTLALAGLGLAAAGLARARRSGVHRAAGRR
jgi:hypothetical protein